MKKRKKQFQQHVLNLEKQKKELEEKVLDLEKRKDELEEKVLNLENQKSPQLELISQSLEKALGQLELDKVNEDEEKNKSKPAIFPSIDETDDSIQNENEENETSAEHLQSSLNKGM